MLYDIWVTGHFASDVQAHADMYRNAWTKQYGDNTAPRAEKIFVGTYPEWFVWSDRMIKFVNDAGEYYWITFYAQTPPEFYSDADDPC